MLPGCSTRSGGHVPTGALCRTGLGPSIKACSCPPAALLVHAVHRRAGCYLFSDEMYRGMEFEAGATLPAGVDCYEKAISLCGMSKAVGLPGLRIGWLASHDAAGGAGLWGMPSLEVVTNNLCLLRWTLSLAANCSRLVSAWQGREGREGGWGEGAMGC